MGKKKKQLKQVLRIIIKQMDKKRLEELVDFATKLLNEHREGDHDWWDDLTEEDKRSIAEGEKDIEEGRYSTLEEVFAKYKNRLK